MDNFAPRRPALSTGLKVDIAFYPLWRSATWGFAPVSTVKVDIVIYLWAANLPFMHPDHRRYAAAALIYAAAFAYILLRWDAIPDPVPVHINVAGEADGFKPKTLINATALLVIGVIMSLAMPLCVPPRSLARQTVGVPAADALPVSETATRRVEKLCDATATVMSKIVLALAALFALLNISMVVPDVNLPFWLEIVLWVAFMVYVVAVALRISRGNDGIAPDAEEETRNHQLRYAGGMGTYSAPNDPMVAAVLPSNPGKIAVNTVHAPGKRYLWRVAASIVAIAVSCIVLPFL